jgi:hypothetical protein
MLRAVSTGDTASWPCQFDNLLHDLQANVKNVDIIASLLQVLEDAHAAATTNQQPTAPAANSPTANENTAPDEPAATTASVEQRTAAAQDENAAPSPVQQTAVHGGDAAVSPANTASSPRPPAEVAPPEHASPAAADSPPVQMAPAMPRSPEPASPVQQLAATASLAPAAQQHADLDLMADARAMAQQVRAVIHVLKSESCCACLQCCCHPAALQDSEAHHYPEWVYQTINYILSPHRCCSALPSRLSGADGRQAAAGDAGAHPGPPQPRRLGAGQPSSCAWYTQCSW